VEKGNHYKLLQLSREYNELWSKQLASKKGCGDDNKKNYTSIPSSMFLQNRISNLIRAILPFDRNLRRG